MVVLMVLSTSLMSDGPGTQISKRQRYTDYGWLRDGRFSAVGGPPAQLSMTARSTASMSQNTPLDSNGVRHQFLVKLLSGPQTVWLSMILGPQATPLISVWLPIPRAQLYGSGPGDVYPRVVLKQWTGKALTTAQPKPNGGYDFGGKQWLKRNLNLFHIKGGQQTGGVHYNQVMSRLGNVAVGNNGYPVLFATENSNNFQEVHNDSGTLVLVHVKDQVGEIGSDGEFEVDQEADNKDYLTTDRFRNRFSEMTVTTDQGSKTNKGLVWLTEYSDKELYNVEKPKLAKIGADRFVVLWESWTGNKPWPNNKANYETTWAMVIDEFGNKIEEAWNVGEIRLERYSEVTVFQGNKVAWARGDQETGKLILYVLDFDESQAAGGDWII